MPVPIDGGPASSTLPLGPGTDDPELLDLDIVQLRELLLHSRGVIAGLKEELHTATSSTSTSILPSSSRKPNYNSLASNSHSNNNTHPQPHPQSSIPSSQHAYDLKSLAETPTPTPTREGFDVGGAESGNYSLKDEVGNEAGMGTVAQQQVDDEQETEGARRGIRSGTPIPSLNLGSGVTPSVHFPANRPIPNSTSTTTNISPSTTTPTPYPSNLSRESQKQDQDAIETLEQERGSSSKKKRPASILGLKRIPSSIVQTTAALHSVGSGIGVGVQGGIGVGGAGRNFSAGGSTSSTSTNPNPNLSPNPNTTSASGSTTPNSVSRPPSPGPGLTLAIPSMLSTKTRRVSSGLTTPSGRMIEELQIEVVNQKAAGDRAREELRLSQRVIGQLTRQNDDLRETKERLRAELEGMNKQMDRKQKLLSEVLERARTAESAVQTHLKDRKTLETNTTKSLAEMTAKLQEAQTLATKSEREAVVLREGFAQYKEMQKREMAELRAEMARVVEGTRAEMEEGTIKRNQLVKALQARTASSAAVEELLRESRALQAQGEERLKKEIEQLKRDLANDPSTRALTMAESLTEELARMKRLMRANAVDET